MSNPDIVENNIKHFNDADVAKQQASSSANSWMAQRSADSIMEYWDFEEEETTVLDFACGAGMVSQKLAPYCKRIVGVDVAPAMVKYFNESVAQQGIDAEEMVAFTVDEFKKRKLEQFDVVFCSQGYHHIEDVDATTDYLSTLVKPGGIFIVIDLDSTSPYRMHGHHSAHGSVAHVGGFTKESLRQILEKSTNFKDVVVENAYETTLERISALQGKGSNPDNPVHVIRFLIATATRT